MVELVKGDTPGDASPAPDLGGNGAIDTGWLPLGVGLAVMVVWGGTPIFSKIAAAQIDPLLVGILRTVIAGAVALPLMLVMRQPLPAAARDRWVLAFSGFAAFIAFPLIFTVGQHSTSAMHGALILATLPVFTSLFGHLLERRGVSLMWVLGCFVALAGEAAVIVWRTGGATAGSSLQGDGLVLASAVVCAAGYAAGARLVQGGYPSLSTTLWGLAGSALVLVPVMVWSIARTGWPHAGLGAWGSILILALLTSIVGYVAWYWALARGGIARVAGVQFTQPLFGLVLAAIVLGERPGPVTVVAGAAILAGMWMVQRASGIAVPD
jgi:drug/metabolite transporter (DMT)-like permease